MIPSSYQILRAAWTAGGPLVAAASAIPSPGPFPPLLRLTLVLTLVENSLSPNPALPTVVAAAAAAALPPALPAAAAPVFVDAAATGAALGNREYNLC